MNKTTKMICAVLFLFIYTPVFFTALVLAIFGFEKMKMWCNKELDFWDKINEEEI